MSSALSQDIVNLIRLAAEQDAKMTPEELRAARRQQAISFIYGNLKATRRHSEGLTREAIAEMYDERSGR